MMESLHIKLKFFRLYMRKLCYVNFSHISDCLYIQFTSEMILLASSEVLKPQPLAPQPKIICLPGYILSILNGASTPKPRHGAKQG